MYIYKENTEKTILKVCLVQVILTATLVIMSLILYFEVSTKPVTKTCDCANNCTEQSIVQNQIQKEYDEEGIAEIRDPYFVEMIDNYITEESLISVCDYIGEMYDIPSKFLQSVAWVESNFKVNAMGGSGDSGLCQIIPGFHLDRMSRLGVTDLMDPYSNILVAADYINELRSLYGNDLGYIIMHYNQGYSAKSQYQSYGLSEHAQKVMNRFYELGGV